MELKRVLRSRVDAVPLYGVVLVFSRCDHHHLCISHAIVTTQRIIPPRGKRNCRIVDKCWKMIGSSQLKCHRNVTLFSKDADKL